MLLEARGVEKSYGGVRALRHVSFDLRAGEVHAIVGENGAGKSTLIKVLTGAVIPDAGQVMLNGSVVEDNSPVRSRALGIAAIYQQPAIFPDLTVAENIALSNETGRLARRVNWARRRAAASELLQRIGADIDPDRDAGTLSMPEQQLVEIAKALGTNVRVLILDEPTASLTEPETQRLLQIVRQLRAEGAGIIYISHRLEELSQIADRITVLRDGETVGTREAAQTDARALIGMMAGRELSAVFPKRAVNIGEPVFETAEFSVGRGEIFGISGLVGAGRTELAEQLFGLRPGAGRVIVDGKAVTIRNPEDAIRAGIAYVPEDRRRHGVAGGLPVRANITLAILKRIANGTLLQNARERSIADDWTARLGIKTDSIDAPVDSLSGGNQQKVAIARWISTDPRVLILDEPTQGIDVGAKAECHRIMCDLAERGLAIVMISSEMAEVLGMSDRIAVMRKHKIVSIVSRAEATAESLLEAALG